MKDYIWALYILIIGSTRKDILHIEAILVIPAILAILVLLVIPAMLDTLHFLLMPKKLI